MKFHDELSVFDYLLTHSSTDLEQGLNNLKNVPEPLKQKVAQLITAYHKNNSHTLFSNIISNQAHSLDIDKNILMLEGVIIQHFKLIRLLGSGGMGAVYLAERCDGQLEQQVAIKIIAPSITLLTSKEIAFKEAHYLARLNHPNIAKIYDVGTTENDLIYLIMEYIEGVPLEKFCSVRSNTEILKLFIKVCDAVSYSHQNRIIHGDLKPDNILVDKLGEPKLVDFGVAHTLSEQSNTIYSAYINGLSNEYASPEQLAGEPLTTQSDVYSLGKVLKSTLHEHNNKELHGIINHTTSDKNQRYRTAAQLASDVDNFINVKPISIYNGSLYRSEKFIRRNPITAIIASGFVLASILFTTVLWKQNTQLKKEQATTEYVANFMVDVFKSADPAAYDGHEVSAQDLLLGAKQRLINDANILTNRPKVILYLAQSLSGVGEYSEALELLALNQADLYNDTTNLLKSQIYIKLSKIESARTALKSVDIDLLSTEDQTQYYTTLANAYFYSDEHDAALTNLQIAESLATQHKQHSAIIEIKNKRTAVLQEQGKLKEQLAEAKQTITFAKRHFASTSAEYLHALFTLQSAYSANEDFDSANALLEDIYKVQITIYPKDHPTLALTLNEMGNNFSRLGEYDKAIPLHTQAIKMVSERYGKKHIDYAYGYSYLGNAYGYQQRFDQAIEAYNEALESNTLMYGEVHTNTLTAARNLGLAYSEKGDQIKAKKILTETLEKTLTLYPEVSYRTALVKTALARALLELEEWQDAQYHLKHALEGFRESVGEDSIRFIRTEKRLAIANEKLAITPNNSML
ncbi:serine/threonine-protein kinase [Pseudoalteromonas lipolytica]|uniref:serine/threonine-protein kinase n=1 Tax=Pseudoalteromonas lipolytica TaxID=570156 RepID=UPI0008255295|nr:serine/threonine-protein kinase [Pseudoalteromonas lipolytica]